MLCHTVCCSAYQRFWSTDQINQSKKHWPALLVWDLRMYWAMLTSSLLVASWPVAIWCVAASAASADLALIWKYKCSDVLLLPAYQWNTIIFGIINSGSCKYLSFFSEWFCFIKNGMLLDLIKPLLERYHILSQLLLEFCHLDCVALFFVL